MDFDPIADRSDLLYSMQIDPLITPASFTDDAKIDWQPYRAKEGIIDIPNHIQSVWVRIPYQSINEPANFMSLLSCPLLLEVYQDTQLLKKFGEYAPGSPDFVKAKMIWPVIRLQASTSPGNIYLKIASPPENHHYRGMCQLIYQGTEIAMINSFVRLNQTQFILGMIFTIIGLLALPFFLIKRRGIIIEFSLFAICIGLTFTGGTEFAWFLTGMGREWWLIWQIFLILFPFPFLLFADRIIATKYQIAKKIAFFHLAWIITYTTIILFDFDISYRSMRNINYIMMILETMIIIPISIYGITKPQAYSRILGSAIIIMLIFAVNDALIRMNIYEGYFISSWGTLFFFSSCVAILILLYLDDEKKLQIEKTLQLRDYSEKLKIEVAERTTDLVNKNEAIIAANKELEDKNLLLRTSNRKMEDLIYKKNLILNRVEAIEEKNIKNLREIFSKVTDNGKSNLISQARFELDELSSQLKPLTNFYRSEKAIHDRHILLVEADRKQQKIMKMALGGSRIRLDISSSHNEAIQFITHNPNIDILIVSSNFLDTAELMHQMNPKIRIILMTSDNIGRYIDFLRKNDFISNIIFKDDYDPSFTARTILTTISKIINEDFFGLEKYLSWGVDVHEHPIKSSRDRNELIDAITCYLQSTGVRKTVINKVSLISDELLMNAIYDAAVYENGKAKYNHMPRTDHVDLLPEEFGKFRFAFDGVLLAISAEDPFGALSRQTIIEYIKTCFDGNYGSINRREGKGGGGMGIYQIISTADLMVVNVKKGMKTEFIAILNVLSPRKGNREVNSFHYFGNSN
ncbi:MAG: hypothetical protein ACOH5I_16435 [Oligoflexus sp.]